MLIGRILIMLRLYLADIVTYGNGFYVYIIKCVIYIFGVALCILIKYSGVYEKLLESYIPDIFHRILYFCWIYSVSCSLVIVVNY